MMIQSRFYNVNGQKWEARFFRKGEAFPNTNLCLPKQGVWAKPVTRGWEYASFVATSWKDVQLEIDVAYLPDWT